VLPSYEFSRTQCPANARTVNVDLTFRLRLIYKMTYGLVRAPVCHLSDSFDKEHLCPGRIHSFSMASAAANFLSTCGSERGVPECSTQPSPTATPHVGQGTEHTCSSVSSFLFIEEECDNIELRNCPIVNTVRVSRDPLGGAVSSRMAPKLT
jgi:hypothetical protein